MTIVPVAAEALIKLPAAVPDRAFDPSHAANLGDLAQAPGAPGGEQAAPAQPAGSLGRIADSPTIKAIFAPLQDINSEALKLSGPNPAGDLKPSDMVMLTLHSQEFLFHCELTSNVANRTSDGVQQLFRQQG